MRTIDLQTQIKFERILLATDFSDDGEIAQAYAVGLALQDESALEITTVVTLPSSPTPKAARATPELPARLALMAASEARYGLCES